MKRKHKALVKLNLMSVFLIAISFISATLAWFAYSGLAKVSTEINIKAWNIELNNRGEKISNDIVISLDDISPGMKSLNEAYVIRNLGDSDAQVNYKITSARVLDYTADGEVLSDIAIEDLLSHDFPFKINISLNKNYVLAAEDNNIDESVFEVSISWPLDSGTDQLDSEWGTKAYNFQQGEETKNKPSVQIEISLTAEQYMDNDDSSDLNYPLGASVLIDVASGKRCSALNATCIKTYVIDTNNKNGDQNVTLLPNPISDHQSLTYSEYDNTIINLRSSWNVYIRELMIDDILKIVSKDVKNSLLIRPDFSDSIIGYLNDTTKLSLEVDKAIAGNGYYSFKNERFEFLSSSECYWIKKDYNADAFALKRVDSDTSKVFGTLKSNTCKIIPVISASKNLLQTKTS